VGGATSTDLLERVRTAVADRYAVERELGRGGMAVVFLARDLRHDRQVALKIFRPELAVGLGAERFLREIQVTARLNHPHILPLYDSGEADGLLFYVMPFVEGETLADLLERERQLSLEQAIQIALEVADALGYAHSYGVVHRDIKPQNIMLSGGHAVVADFGIARAVEQAGSEQLTETGMAVGTPAYMSPEQAVGAAHVDGRTDIYSLGCVLYEALVGQPPFTGPTPQAVMARHSLDNVPPPHIVRQSIPAALESVLYCALEKSPADRFHTARDFADALRAVATGQTPHLTNSMLQRARTATTRPWGRIAMAAGVGVAVVAVGVLAVRALRTREPGGEAVRDADGRAVAVLYLEDRSRDATLAPVADGLTEGLIAELARVPGLDVVSRNGVAAFRDGGVPRDSIARVLGVGTLVEGSVEPAGDRLRVALRLTDAVTGVDFARASFELPAADPRAVQDSAVAEVVRMLRERLGTELQVRRSRETAPSGAAWTLLQRGEHARKEAEAAFAAGDAERGVAAFDSAEVLLDRAAAADARWVEPLVLRGQIAYRRGRLSGDLEARLAAIEEAVRFADRVLELEPFNAAALELRGTVQYWHWLLGVTPDAKDAEALLLSAQADLEAAVGVDPALASAHAALSHLYYQTRGKVAALIEARLAYEADAFLANAPDVLWRLFLGSYDLEQFTQARRWCDEGARRFPSHYWFAECRLWALTMAGVPADPEEAWRLVAAATQLAPESQRTFEHHRAMVVAGAVLARAGLADSARRVLLAARAGGDVDPQQELPYLEAYVRTILGDDEEAVALLRQLLAGASGEADSGSDEWATHWWWRGLQGRTDFQALVQASR
jgi:eukaryotic-like serine/threonine-protein kinase